MSLEMTEEPLEGCVFIAVQKNISAVEYGNKAIGKFYR